MNKAILTMLVALAVGAPMTAFAQDAPAPAPEPAPAPAPAEPAEGDQEGNEPEEVVQETVVEETVVEKPEAKPKAKKETPAAPLEAVTVREDPLKEEIKEYWSTEGRELDAVTDRLFSRDGRFELALLVGIEPTSPYWWYLSLGLRMTYNFTQVHGLELSGSYQLGFKTSLHKYIEKAVPAAKSEMLDDKAMFRADLVYIWRPFYGKFGLFSRKLAHFDWNLAVGAGVNGVNRPDKAQKAVSMAFEPELTFGTGFSVLFYDSFNVRFDVRGFATRGPEKYTKDANGTTVERNYWQRLRFPVEISFGAAYLF